MSTDVIKAKIQELRSGTEQTLRDLGILDLFNAAEAGDDSAREELDEIRGDLVDENWDMYNYAMGELAILDEIEKTLASS